MAGWLQGRGLPSAPVVKARLLLPNLPQVLAMVDSLTDSVPVLDGREKPSSHLWRRVVLGTPGSQHVDAGGNIPTTSLIWSKPRRLRAKEPPPIVV